MKVDRKDNSHNHAMQVYMYFCTAPASQYLQDKLYVLASFKFTHI